MTDPADPGNALVQAIASLEAQRAVLGDAVTDAALAPLRAQLAAQSSAPVAAQGPDSQLAPLRRRLVTVLFLDITGSTAMTRQLDPEDVSAVIDSALRRFTDIVIANGGRVLQYAGDSVLAAFGAEVSREDDAERAVRAGLELLAAALEHSAFVERVHGLAGFGIRVGIHTGHVVLGGGIDEASTIRGFTVNIAARMEQAAPPGSLRISHDTWHHVRGVFDVEAQPALQVKGHAEPLRTYLVQGTKQRSFRVPTRGIDGAETALVGRDAEIDRLIATFDRTLQVPGLHAVTVLAEAGLGKSRLMHELQHRLEAHPHTCWLMLGRSQPGSTLQPFGLLRDVLTWRLQIADSDSADVARNRLVDGLAPLFPDQGELQAELLGQLIGMDFSASPRLRGLLGEPRLMRDRGLAAFTAYLKKLSASDGSPVVMLLDDLQWADDASLDWLQQLQGSTELPLALVMAARPALLERRPAWGEGHDRHERITLATLAGDQREALAAALLRRLPEIPDALRFLLDDQAEGNPFYAEELVKMLIDEGVIVVDGEAWHLHTDRLHSAQIPGTLTGVLQARIDSLTGPARRALQMASIVGPVFWDAALSALDAGAAQSLPLLEQKAMVQPHADSAFADAHEQGFHHHLLHQVTYDTVLKAERRAGHGRAAQWLAERVGDREAEYLAIAAEHYQRAGDTARAIDWFWRAQRAAVNRFAYPIALIYVRKLLDIIEPTQLRERHEVFKALHYIAVALGRSELRTEASEARERIAEQLDDDAVHASCAVERALQADHAGDHALAGAMALRAVAFAERAGDAASAALAYGELAWLAAQRHDGASARHHVELGLRWAGQAAQAMLKRDDDIYEMQLLLVAVHMHIVECDWNEAERTLTRALALAESSRYARIFASGLEFANEVAMALCDVERAARHLDRLDVLARQTMVSSSIATASQRRGRLAMLRGEYEQALPHFEAAAAEMERNGSHRLRASCLVDQGAALAGAGRPEAALEAHRRALAIYDSVDADSDASASRLLIADLVRAQGDQPGALAAVRAEQAVLDDDEALNAAHSPQAARMAAWRVLCDAGDPGAARQLELALRELTRRTEKIDDPAARARVLGATPLHREIIAGWQARGA